MRLERFVSPVWEKVFAWNSLTHFDAIWQAFDRAEIRINEGVCAKAVVALELPNGGSTAVRIERAELTSTKQHALLEHELDILLQLRLNKIVAEEPIYFLQKDNRILLVTCELTHFISLAEFKSRCLIQKYPCCRKFEVLRCVGQTLNRLHRARLVHGHLDELQLKVYDSWRTGKRRQTYCQVALSNLQIVRRSYSRVLSTWLELAQLQAGCSGWSRTEQLRLFKAYRDHKRLTRLDKWFIRLILWRSARIAHLRGKVATLNADPHCLSRNSDRLLA